MNNGLNTPQKWTNGININNYLKINSRNRNSQRLNLAMSENIVKTPKNKFPNSPGITVATMEREKDRAKREIKAK